MIFAFKLNLKIVELHLVRRRVFVWSHGVSKTGIWLFCLCNFKQLHKQNQSSHMEDWTWNPIYTNTKKDIKPFV